MQCSWWDMVSVESQCGVHDFLPHVYRSPLIQGGVAHWLYVQVFTSSRGNGCRVASHSSVNNESTAFSHMNYSPAFSQPTCKDLYQVVHPSPSICLSKFWDDLECLLTSAFITDTFLSIGFPWYHQEITIDQTLSMEVSNHLLARWHDWHEIMSTMYSDHLERARHEMFHNHVVP